MIGQHFQELIRSINCLSGDDFKKIFGANFEYYLMKRETLGLASFICYLDHGNIERVLKFIELRRLTKEYNEVYND